MIQLIEYAIIGAATGSIYALGALCFVTINKPSNVFNFAMGEMMMMGAYFYYLFSVQGDLHWLPALVLALAMGGLLGAAIERLILRRLLGQPHVVLVMVTFGIGSALRGVAGMIWGANILNLPQFLPRAPIFIGDMLIPGKLAWGMVVMVVIILAFVLYYRFSRTGIAIRATAADQITAEVLGINIRGVFVWSWVVAGSMATMAGITAASINGLTPNLGLIALEVLAVVMLAGMTSVGGVLIAGILVGMINALVGAYIDSSWQQFMPYLIVLAMMTVRPHGLFGEKPVERI
ncbi:branched-chain amino acid ABC transporter permease [Falsigemmobacter intermedius]|uniref:branched-chain amino acid ABC transporter permease n=1 Tax=Falsigemmobacter intermedius TaxID=1553448 RepID=UPI003F08AA42